MPVLTDPRFLAIGVTDVTAVVLQAVTAVVPLGAMADVPQVVTAVVLQDVTVAAAVATALVTPVVTEGVQIFARDFVLCPALKIAAEHAMRLAKTSATVVADSHAEVIV